MHPRFQPGFLAAAVCVLALFISLAPVRADDTFVELSSLDLTRATQGWGTPQANRSVDGHPITLGGKTFAKGFGTHSPGILCVRLNGAAKRFTATVGIDDEVRDGRGSAEFLLIGDEGKVLFRSGVLRQGMPPKPVDVDLTGQQQLILHVTDGGDGFEFDHADWADARFVRTGDAAARLETMSLPVTAPEIDRTPAPAAPKIGGAAQVGVLPNTPLLWTVPVTGLRPMHFEALGLPAGVHIDPVAGVIAGTPRQNAEFAVKITARNAAGEDRRTVHIVVGPKIALTPPLGWNSYDAFGDSVTEAETLANATYLRDHLQPYGWDTVVVDYRWYDPGAHDNNANGRAGAELTMDANGRLLPSPNRFPSGANGVGFKALADQIHAMGLRFGIHIMRGIPRNAVNANLPIEGSTFRAADAADTADKCPWCADMYGVRGDTPAGRAYYDSIFRLYAQWGVDYVKMDDTSAPYHAHEIEAAHDAILKSGRSIVYSLSPGETPIAEADHVAAHANLWRVSGDFWDNWRALNQEFTLAERWKAYPAAGHWPDADMLPLGHLSVGNRSVDKDRQTRFTRAEQMTLISFWSLLPSPLMLGANLPDNDSWTLALLTNPEVLALNQDARAAAAQRTVDRDELEVWTKPLADGSIAVGIFNRGDLDAECSGDSAALGLPAGGKWRVRDLWLRRDLTSGASAAYKIPAHGVVLLRYISSEASARHSAPTPGQPII